MNSVQQADSIIGNICVGSKEPNRKNLLAYEDVAKTLPQIDIPVNHYIHGGMYAREITIPKGTIITGAIYKFNHFDIMVSGDVTVSTDSGERKRLQGYNFLYGFSGKKRAGYAHEDTTWITFHPYALDSGEATQEMITSLSFNELERFYVEMDRLDYMSILDEIGVTEQEVRVQTEYQHDMIELPEGHGHIQIKESSREGLGVFNSNRSIEGGVIGVASLDGNRTPIGRYTNHSQIPNAKMVFENGDVILIALEDIEQNVEVTVNYRDVLLSKQGVK